MRRSAATHQPEVMNRAQHQGGACVRGVHHSACTWQCDAEKWSESSLSQEHLRDAAGPGLRSADCAVAAWITAHHHSMGTAHGYSRRERAGQGLSVGGGVVVGWWLVGGGGGGEG